MNIEYLPYIDDLVVVPLGKFIYSGENYCGYEDLARDFMVEWVYPMFLETKSESSN